MEQLQVLAVERGAAGAAILDAVNEVEITGACGRCQSGHCSAQFSVRYDCSPPQQ